MLSTFEPRTKQPTTERIVPICFRSSSIQVARETTGFDITVMTNKRALRDWPIEHFINGDVSADQLGISPNHPIAVCILGASPQPTGALLRDDGNLRPKTLAKRTLVPNRYEQSRAAPATEARHGLSSPSNKIEIAPITLHCDHTRLSRHVVLLKGV